MYVGARIMRHRNCRHCYSITFAEKRLLPPTTALYLQPYIEDSWYNSVDLVWILLCEDLLLYTTVVKYFLLRHHRQISSLPSNLLVTVQKPIRSISPKEASKYYEYNTVMSKSLKRKHEDEDSASSLTLSSSRGRRGTGYLAIRSSSTYSRCIFKHWEDAAPLLEATADYKIFEKIEDAEKYAFGSDGDVYGLPFERLPIGDESPSRDPNILDGLSDDLMIHVLSYLHGGSKLDSNFKDLAGRFALVSKKCYRLYKSTMRKFPLTLETKHLCDRFLPKLVGLVNIGGVKIDTISICQTFLYHAQLAVLLYAIRGFDLSCLESLELNTIRIHEDESKAVMRTQLKGIQYGIPNDLLLNCRSLSMKRIKDELDDVVAMNTSAPLTRLATDLDEENDLDRILRYSQHLKYLSVTVYQSTSHIPVLSSIIENQMPSLKELSFPYNFAPHDARIHITATSKTVEVVKCRSFKRIVLNCPNVRTIDTKGVPKFVGNATLLKLEDADFHAVDINDLEAFDEFFSMELPNLKRFYFSKTSHDVGVWRIHSKSLETFKFGGAWDEEFDDELDGESILDLQECHALRYIDVTMSPCVTILWPKSEMVEVLEIGNNKGYRWDETMSARIELMPSLRRLILRGIIGKVVLRSSSLVEIINLSKSFVVRGEYIGPTTIDKSGCPKAHILEGDYNDYAEKVIKDHERRIAMMKKMIQGS